MQEQIIFSLEGVNPDEIKVQCPPKRVMETIKRRGERLPISMQYEIRIYKRGNTYDKDNNPYKNRTNCPCWWHRMSFDGHCMGIPSRIEEDKIFMEGTFCSYDCCYAYLLEEEKKGNQSVHENVSEIITNLKVLFSRDYPDKKLYPAPDWRLLSGIGDGTIDVKEFVNSLKGYVVKKHSIKIGKIIYNYEIEEDK